MAIYSTGQSDSGIDRALQVALDAELDEELLSGELWQGEREQFPEPIPAGEARRPWQMPISKKRDPPAATSLLPNLRARGAAEPAPSSGETVDDERPRPVEAVRGVPEAKYVEARRNALERKPQKKRYLTWKPERVGIVMIHGIGPQLAGQTLLDWTRPIIDAVRDASKGDKRLEVPPKSARDIKDPVHKANLDFSGETFPVIQVNIPRRKDLPADDPRSTERTWVFTETWWASEVRAPPLATMIGWLGEQGGVGRIVQGIQENMLGRRRAIIGRISLQPIISVVTSFVLLLFVTLLGIAKLIPFGPLRDAVVLRLAASFLTDWFGGARTLLRDPSQSANVRHRLVMTVKALRAYGCRNVVIVAHSGGTMVSLVTLTDPAFANLRVQKLITIGEALNLGWRLNDENPDQERPSPPIGDRMAADLGALQPDLQWRDFWGTHDPAPSGRPQLPKNFEGGDFPRFTAERVYNRMSILQDHGGYWDNDEHFVIPLIREIDVPTGDRSGSRFYGDDEESYVRYRRKERVGLLALWRRALLSLPLVAILAAATVSTPGFVATAGDITLQLFGLIPGNELLAQAADAFVGWIAGLSTVGVPLVPAALQVPSLLPPLYLLGTWALQAIMIVLLMFALLPGQTERLWANPQRGIRPRFLLFLLDIGVGIGVFAMVIAGFFLLLSPSQQAQVIEGLSLAPFAAVVIGGLFAAAVGWFGSNARAYLRRTEAPANQGGGVGRNGLILVSSLALVVILLSLIVIGLGMVLVLIDGSPEHIDTQRFVIGAIAVLVAFHLIGRLGTWRWGVWDVRERMNLRQRPMTAPPRRWPYILGFLLTLVVFAATSVVALGAPGSSWYGVELDAWLVAIAVSITLMVFGCLAKDIVDNDIAVDQAGTGDMGSGPETVTTDEPPKAP